MSSRQSTGRDVNRGTRITWRVVVYRQFSMNVCILVVAVSCVEVLILSETSLL